MTEAACWKSEISRREPRKVGALFQKHAPSDSARGQTLDARKHGACSALKATKPCLARRIPTIMAGRFARTRCKTHKSHVAAAARDVSAGSELQIGGLVT